MATEAKLATRAQRLDGCPACREEHDSLYALVTSTQLL